MSQGVVWCGVGLWGLIVLVLMFSWLWLCALAFALPVYFSLTWVGSLFCFFFCRAIRGP
jgi:hypothetical protein